MAILAVAFSLDGMWFAAAGALLVSIKPKIGRSRGQWRAVEHGHRD